MKVLAAIIPGFSVTQSYKNNNNKLLPIWPKSGTICLKIDFGWIYSIYVTGNAVMTVHVPVYSPFSSIGRNCVHPFSHHNNSFVLPLSTFLVSTVSAQHHPSISPSRPGFLWESDRDAELFILCVELTLYSIKQTEWWRERHGGLVIGHLHSRIYRSTDVVLISQYSHINSTLNCKLDAYRGLKKSK